MKIEIENKEYLYVSDDARVIDSTGAFLLTHHNKKFKEQAIENGCTFFLKPPELFEIWKLSDIKIIGITGTNGKTTCSNIMAHILKKSGKKVVVSGTEGIFMHTSISVEKITPRTHTTPEILTTLYNLKVAKESGAEFFIMEVSSHGIFQKRVEGLRFNTKVFTNLSQDHLDFHNTMQEYADVKSSFFLDHDSEKIINADDRLIKYNAEHATTYSLKNTMSDIYTESKTFENGITAGIIWKEEKYLLKSKMIGEFNLYNILASIVAIDKTSNIGMFRIIENIADFTGVAGRMELIAEKTKKSSKIEVFSDYAHTPDAIKNVLESISKESHVITIIGSGGDRDSTKRPIMSKVACKNSYFVFLTSDNPRSESPEDILKDMEKGVDGLYKNYEVVVDRKKAIKMALAESERILSTCRSVTVAILGKGDEDYMEILGKKIPYSDKSEVIKYFNSKSLDT